MDGLVGLTRELIDLTIVDLVAIVAIAIVAVVVAYDARRVKLPGPSGYGFGTFIVIVAGAIVFDWIGAAVAAIAVLVFYFVARERRKS